MLDPLYGVDNENFDAKESALQKEEKYYRIILRTWVIVQSCMMIWLIYLFIYEDLSIHMQVLLILNTMIMNGGVGITIAHELGHKTNKLDKFLGKFLLVQVGYGHYWVEHNRGHHVHVATPEDPATAKKNQSYYSFWYQAVVKGFISSIRIENERLKQRKQKINIWTHETYRLTIIQLLLLSTITYTAYLLMGQFPTALFCFLMLQSFLSFSLLESVDYIEHYGMLRHKTNAGVYEKVNPKHSWNANFILSNYLLFQLQRHADHHLYATKDYQLLNAYNDSPQLPNGYPGMVLISLIPPIWYKVMNKRLEEWQDKIHGEN